MTDKSNKWMKHLQQEMKGYRRTVAPTMLDDIKQEMARRGMSVEQPKRTALTTGMRWMAAASVALALVGGSVYYWNVQQSGGQKLATVAQQTAGGASAASASVKPSASASLPGVSSSLSGVSSSSSGVSTSSPMLAKASSSASSADGAPLPIIIEPLEMGSSMHGQEEQGQSEVVLEGGDEPLLAAKQEAQPAESSPTKVVGQSNDTSMPAPRQSETHDQHYYASTDDYEWLKKIKDDADDHSKWTAQVYFSGMHNVEGSTGGYADMIDNFASADLSWDDMPISTELPFFTAVYSTPYAETSDMEYHHKQPIKVGAEVAWDLDKRWTLQTGLFYSYLSSDVTVSHKLVSDEHYDQRLHYIGLPVSVSYNWLRSNQLRLYTSLGGEVQRMVSGSLQPVGSTGGTKTSLSSNRMQWGAGVAVGVEYKPIPLVGFYLEPGVRHYFDNHSSIETIYQEKPWSFSLSLGLRFDLSK